MSGKSVPILSRILSKIKEDEITGCWNFTGATIESRGGKSKNSRKAGRYGYIGISIEGKHKNILVHRYMYWHHFLNPQGFELNKLTKEMCVCHKCDNTLCCNPDHLFLGTNKDNSQDASKKGRLQKGEDHTGSKLTESQVLEIFKMKGTLKEIAYKYNIKSHTVLDIKNREIWNWLTKNETPVIENHSTKLTETQVLEIYAMEGNRVEIGKKYRVSHRTVTAIKAGTNWAWLTKGKSNG
jgi:hypothetical protein